MAYSGERDPRTGVIIAAAIEVHNLLGPGFLEGVYQEAMSVELSLRGIPFQREAVIPIVYKGKKLGTPYRADFICFGEILIELKALGRLGGLEEAQILHYIKAIHAPLGLLLNFGAKSLEIRRFAGLQPVESVKSVDFVFPTLIEIPVD